MKLCLTCREEYPDRMRFCPRDGAFLVPKPVPVDLVGLTINEKYRLESVIGEGGMGKVYRATHLEMGSPVAVKILHSQMALDENAVERFRREARAAARIRHPNATAVMDFGVLRNERIAYLVMELLEGVMLKDLIEKEKTIDDLRALTIIRQTCLAVHAAHSEGIVHRDLKPDNICVLKDRAGIEYIKVLDFGIARIKMTTGETRLTQQGMVMGTPYYMSPEQGRDEELDARSDIYSLGVILYEMLSGTVPFMAATPMGVILKHATEPPRPLREIRPEVPRSVEAVILKALSKNRKDRQQTAIELATDFERALQQAGVIPRPPTVPPPSPASPPSIVSPPSTPAPGLVAAPAAVPEPGTTPAVPAIPDSPRVEPDSRVERTPAQPIAVDLPLYASLPKFLPPAESKRKSRRRTGDGAAPAGAANKTDAGSGLGSAIERLLERAGSALTALLSRKK